MVAIVQRVAVCGTGAMGSGIAQVAAQAGCEVIVFDVEAEALAASKTRDVAAISSPIARGKMDASMGGKLPERLTWRKNLLDLSQAHLMIESISKTRGLRPMTGPEPMRRG